MKFTKMHGIGNDFIVINDMNLELANEDLGEMAQRLSDRHYGIGADGIILVQKSGHSNFKMRIFNSDGSEPEMCGNGIRCFAKYVYEKKFIDSDIISIETKSGVKVVSLVLKDNEVIAVEVDMGKPVLKRSLIPVNGPDMEKVIDEELLIDGMKYKMTYVSMGNPHAVLFIDDLEPIDLQKIGPLIENHQNFPQKINVEFVKIDKKAEITLRVWERGAGETLACGTGACAAVVAGFISGRTERKLLVHLPGGNLQVEWQEDDSHVIMTGPAEFVYEGEID